MNKDNKLANFENFFLNETIEISLTNFIIALLLSAFLSYIIKKVYREEKLFIITLNNKNENLIFIYKDNNDEESIALKKSLYI